MDGYLGQFELSDTPVAIPLAIKVADVPMDPDGGNPTFRIYEADTLLASQTGSLTKMETGSITGATNASPIEITSAGHGLQTGNIVKITGVTGNTAANGTFVVTRTGANTFTLDGSTGNGAYVDGGTWHLAGAYLLTLTLNNGNGYDVGKYYCLRIDWNNSGTAYVAYYSFLVT